MSVLSDNQIAQLCKPYTFMVESSRNQPALPGIPEEPEKFFPTDRSEEEIKAWIENKTLFVLGDGSNNGAHSAKSYRPLTEEERVKYSSSKMIYPFNKEQVRKVDGKAVISYGLSSYVYDITPAEDFKIFSNLNSTIVDPKRMDEKCLLNAEIRTDEYGDRYIVLPPSSYLLSHSSCTFNMPSDVMGLTLAKSTYARAGVTIPCTLLQAGWSGELVLEISNSTTLPVKIYIDEGIVSIIFFGDLPPCNQTYKGLYQNQAGIKLPTV